MKVDLKGVSVFCLGGGVYAMLASEAQLSAKEI